LKKKREIKQKIKSFYDFEELLCKQGLKFLEQNEPEYCKKFKELEKQGLSIKNIKQRCDKLLTGKIDKFIDLLESLSEVGYYWKRLMEVIFLVETKTPEELLFNSKIFQNQHMSWLAYNCDYFWYSIYSLEERLIVFLKKFKRMYNSPSTSETQYLEGWIKSVKISKNEFTKTIRDPMTHIQSRYADIYRERHFWESKLIRKDYIDFYELYELNCFMSKNDELKLMQLLGLEYYEELSFIFDQLCTFSLERLELK